MIQAKPALKCAYCDAEGLNAPPEPMEGALDAVCCETCLKWSILDVAAHTLRKPSMIEFLGLMADTEARKISLKLRLARVLSGDEANRLPREQFDDIAKHTTERVSQILKDTASLMEDPRDGLTLMLRVVDFVATQVIANMALFTGSGDARALADTVCMALSEGLDRPYVQATVKEALKVRKEMRAKAGKDD